MPVFTAPLRRSLPICALAAALLAGCASPIGRPPGDDAWPVQLARWQRLDALLLGEQHDAAAHQQWQRETVQWLAARGRLAALVLEMAEAGAATDGLPPQADAEQVRAALRWNEAAWPWQRYAGVVMAAVAAGVPVRGGNLDAAGLRAALQDETLDDHLPPGPLARQRQAIEQGHCGLLPAARVQPMVRVQLARDASLARALRQALQDGRTVVLVAGYGHVQRSLGVPTWLPANIESKVAIAQAGQALAAIESEADFIRPTPALPPEDYCAGLRARWPAQR
ncbi:ChaN family lipoprotein [Pulveribacter sp.]|uniref:ChaN family lipoprotein n=1 Tax=Pulveribacter sp. TaxID=2678893 RepID=UPI0028B0C9A3|nr:ChaN family lipoprotein [Pulveribacter sp.]